jgi:excisionase family DNA binding protein
MSMEAKITTAEAFEALWTAEDVASYLRASKSFVYKAAEDGRLPCLRIGSMMRFDPTTIRAFAQGRPSGGNVVALPSRRG